MSRSFDFTEALNRLNISCCFSIGVRILFHKEGPRKDILNLLFFNINGGNKKFDSENFAGY